MPGQNDLWPWLQSIMQNQGAARPSNPAAYPAAAPQAMPGSGVTGMPAVTPGAPSMGYPALGALGAQPQPPPQAQPPSQLQDSLTVNPHGDGPPDVMSPAAMAAAQAAAQPQPQPAPAYQGGGIGGDWRFPTAVAPGQGGIGSDARFPLASPPGSPSATPKPAGATPTGPLASPGVTATPPMKRTPGAPNLGYYQGNPRFGTVQYQTPNSSASRAPIYTTLNLGGGQQPAANPANVPAANAQPVSSMNNPRIRPAGPLPATAEENAPWWMGPLQQGNIWRGSGGPSGRINR